MASLSPAPPTPVAWRRFSADHPGGEPFAPTNLADHNVLLRGDNLAALRYLLPTFEGSIKLIYLDPPYNTGSELFNYPDRQARAAWLADMEARLRLARQFLRPDGYLCVHISFHECAYLKVLLDELFDHGEVMTIHLLVRHPERILKADKRYHDVVEHVLVYADHPNAPVGRQRFDPHKQPYEYEVEELAAGQVKNVGDREVTVFRPGEYRIRKGDATPERLRKISVRGSIREANSSGRFYVRHIEPNAAHYPPETLLRVPAFGGDRLGYRYFYTPPRGRQNGGYYQAVPLKPRLKPYPNFFDMVREFNQVSAEGGVQFRNGKKPEALLKLLFEMFGVRPGDRVLDFFLGSGTTAAVAHKLGLPYIGVEARDYGPDDPSVRLRHVVGGDATGISDAVGWRGGGAFLGGALPGVG